MHGMERYVVKFVSDSFQNHNFTIWGIEHYAIKINFPTSLFKNRNG